MRRQVQSRLAIQSGLHAALRDGTLSLAYQPIVTLIDGQIRGAEALLRWNQPGRGEVPPAEFIPVARQSGLIVPMGAWVMDQACRDILRLEKGRELGIAVNVSIRQLAVGRFATWLAAILEQTGFAPSALTVEITESVLMDEIEPIRRAFEVVRDWGVKVAIDDFGTGYSSLARLQHLPIDAIKLDRPFVSGINARPEARDMATAIWHLGATVGAEVIAEGVETQTEASVLVELGYTVGQGYLFARPMPIEALKRHLCERREETGSIVDSVAMG